MSTPLTFQYDFPVVITPAGLQPQAPASLLTQLLAGVSSTNPGYTVLPGGLIEDISSTDVGALVLIDQAKVDAVNSLTPFGANEFTLQQLGNIYGVLINQVTNTSVVVVFSGTPGYVIPNGFLVSDGTYVYQVQTGGIIASGGASSGLTAIATTSGTWTPAASSVTQLQSSVPVGISLTVTNASAGTPGQGQESYYSFRTRVLQAGLAASVGTARYIKTLLGQVTGVTANAVSVQQNGSGGIRVIASGGDTYQIAYAIFMSIADPSELVGSAIDNSRNITVSIYDYPNTYSILYVNTQTQTITMAITWNTTLTSFTGGAAFASLVQQPLADYINGLSPGQVINVFEMNAIFQSAVAGVLDPSLLTRLVFTVSINGTPTSPGSGTEAITGDPESNFICALTGITVTQG